MRAPGAQVRAEAAPRCAARPGEPRGGRGAGEPDPGAQRWPGHRRAGTPGCPLADSPEPVRAGGRGTAAPRGWGTAAEAADPARTGARTTAGPRAPWAAGGRGRGRR